MITKAHQWVQNNADPQLAGRYRCPNCGRQYRPWVKDASTIPFNKVFVVQREGSQVDYFPMIWSETMTQNLKDDLKNALLQVNPTPVRNRDSLPSAPTVARAAEAVGVFFFCFSFSFFSFFFFFCCCCCCCLIFSFFFSSPPRTLGLCLLDSQS